MNKVRMNLNEIDGNAFALLGAFAVYAKQQGWSQQDIDAVRDEATASDYDHLVRTLIAHTEPSDSVELRVWWIPQVPMEPFVYPVPTLEAARMLCHALAQYDLFQYRHSVRPDFDNAGGAKWRHPDLTGGEWLDFDPLEDDDYQEVEATIAKLSG